MKTSSIIFLFTVLCLPLFAIKPIATYINTPENFDLKYETLSLKTADDYTLAGWHIFPREGTNLSTSIIFSYGDMGNISYWLTYAYYLSYMGYDVWMYDYRGFGKSEAFEIKDYMLFYTEFVNDLSAMVDMVRKEKEGDKIVLLSFSMGGIMSMLYMNEHPDAVDYYIGDGHTYSPDNVPAKLGKTIIVPDFEVEFESIYRKVDIPFLLFQGSEDILLTKAEADKIRKMKKNVDIVTYTGDHLASFQVLGNDYFYKIHTFIQGDSENKQ